ncbi:MAG: hypothetical protein J6E46_13410 [Faecalicoccus sp.]|nr:hypothetical protein [Faecalicoccus sp.]
MSNLGWYQLMTTWAKKVGGPKQFMAMIFGAGAAAATAVVEGINWISRDLSDKEKKRESTIIYTVMKDGISKEGLSFKVGENFRILEYDRDIGLIEKIGDDKNPYVVSLSFLHTISDYGEW